jgi:hypothetical protein
VAAAASFLSFSIRAIWLKVGLPLVLILTILGCDAKVEYRDVSERHPEILKRRYEVSGVLLAYGIRKHSQAPIDYITLMPPPGIEGKQIVDLGRLPMGTAFKVKNVLLSNRFPDSNESIIIEFDSYNFNVTVPIRIELFRGNEGRGTFELNAKIYKRL